MDKLNPCVGPVHRLRPHLGVKQESFKKSLKTNVVDALMKVTSKNDLDEWDKYGHFGSVFGDNYSIFRLAYSVYILTNAAVSSIIKQKRRKRVPLYLSIDSSLYS